MSLRQLLIGQADAFTPCPHLFVSELARSQGGIGRFRLYHRQAVAIADADLVRQLFVRQADVFQRGRNYRAVGHFLGDGLISTDADLWRPARHWLEPGFRREHLAIAMPAIRSIIAAELQRWQTCSAQHDGCLELVPALQVLTAKLTTRVLFSLAWTDEQISVFCHQIDQSLNQIVSLMRSPLLQPAWWPGSLAGRLQSAGRQVNRMLAPALQNPEQHDRADSLLPILLKGRAGSRCPLSAARWLDELKTLAVAAFETSATTLTWTLDLLARHPQELEAVQQEIDRVIGDAAPTLETIEHLPRCRQVLLEGMRLWPAVYNIVREAVKPTTLAGHAIAKGTLAFVSVYGLHRHPDLWDRPDQFLPERFADPTIRRPGYLPFSIGPHACLGKHLAMLQMQTLLIMLCQRHQIAVRDPSPPEPIAQVTLRPRQSPILQLKPRTRS